MGSSVFSVGVDRGRTWIRAVAMDSRGRRVRFLRAPAPALEGLRQFLRRRLRAWRARPRYLGVATQGVWTHSERARLQRSLRSLARRVTVMSDAEGAWRAAFGENMQDGVLVNSGTGSIALARDRRGRFLRRGGLGPILGDEGSACWIGRAWLKARLGNAAPAGLLKLVRSPQAARRIAALAPGVLHHAQHGNRTARRIIREAQGHLATLAIELAEAMRLQRAVPVSWSGSLLDNPWFRSGFFKVLKQDGARAGRRFQAATPRCDIVTAMAGHHLP